MPSGLAGDPPPMSYQLGSEELQGYRLLAVAYQHCEGWSSASLSTLSPVMKVKYPSCNSLLQPSPCKIAGTRQRLKMR